MAEGRHLEPLVIIEEGDLTFGVSEREDFATEAVAELNKNVELPIQGKSDGHIRWADSEINTCETSVEEQSHAREQGCPKEQVRTEEDEEGRREEEGEDKAICVVIIQQGDSTKDQERGEQPQEWLLIKEIRETDKTQEQDVDAPTDLQVDTSVHTSPDHQPKERRNSAPDSLKEAHMLTPEFPESLYELLCTLQEGRRLNDQRCSFRLETHMRRRCHSEPNTTKPVPRVIFSSMTSLQAEEFFELVATSQARRLNDQRAELLKASPAKSRVDRLRGSIRQLSLRRPAPVPVPLPVPKEDLYNMILTTQAQGRMEDQRSTAPGPMDDEDFFSLLLRVQGGRMDEQRTELPCILRT